MAIRATNELHRAAPVSTTSVSAATTTTSQATCRPFQTSLLWIVFALIIGFAVGYAAHVPPTSDTTTTTSVATAQPTNQPTQVPTKAVTPTPTHALKWTTVQSFSGNGTKKTSVFNMPGDWKLVWTCDPASFGGSYNVIVDVNNADSTPFDAGAVNTICASGNTHGETEEHQSGQVYLAVNSEAAWSISIQELK